MMSPRISTEKRIAGRQSYVRSTSQTPRQSSEYETSELALEKGLLHTAITQKVNLRKYIAKKKEAQINMDAVCKLNSSFSGQAITHQLSRTMSSEVERTQKRIISKHSESIKYIFHSLCYKAGVSIFNNCSFKLEGKIGHFKQFRIQSLSEMVLQHLVLIKISRFTPAGEEGVDRRSAGAQEAPERLADPSSSDRSEAVSEVSEEGELRSDSTPAAASGRAGTGAAAGAGPWSAQSSRGAALADMEVAVSWGGSRATGCGVGAWRDLRAPSI